MSDSIKVERYGDGVSLNVRSMVTTLEREDAFDLLAKLQVAMTGDRATLSVSNPEEPRKAAVALIQREDGRVLCVWNLRYNGFSLPGGMVEDGETVDVALRRELREETSLSVVTAEPLFEGAHDLRPKTGDRGGRASVVALFRVTASGEPREVEPGCRIEWLTWEEFLAQSPFGAFYRKILPGMCSSDAPPTAPTCRSCGSQAISDEQVGHLDTYVERAAQKLVEKRTNEATSPPFRERHIKCSMLAGNHVYKHDPECAYAYETWDRDCGRNGESESCYECGVGAPGHLENCTRVGVRLRSPNEALTINMQSRAKPLELLGRHVHTCPECHRSIHCPALCAVEPDLELDDGTARGSYVVCDSCEAEKRTDKAEAHGPVLPSVDGAPK